MIKRILNLLFYKKVKEVKRVKTGEEVYFDLFEQFILNHPIENALVLHIDSDSKLDIDNVKTYELVNAIQSNCRRFYIVSFGTLDKRLQFEIGNRHYLESRHFLKLYYIEALTFWFNNSNYTSQVLI